MDRLEGCPTSPGAALPSCMEMRLQMAHCLEAVEHPCQNRTARKGAPGAPVEGVVECVFRGEEVGNLLLGRRGQHHPRQ